jgi:hypothetical protein
MTSAPSTLASHAPNAPPAVRLRPSFRRRVVRSALLLVILLTLYVLSIGPMWWAWYSGMYVSTENNYWVIAFYEPLRVACHIEWINDIVTAYIEWWIL